MIVMLSSNWSQQCLWVKLLDSSTGHMTGLAKWLKSAAYFPPGKV